jgi:hypothetical protein
MTTYYPFSSNPKQPPSFMPTLDGNQYTIVVLWNFSAKRFYVKCTDMNGNLIFNVPLISSLVSNPILSISYDINRLRVFVVTKNPINIKNGGVFNVNIINCSPSGYNGFGPAVVCTDYTFVYNLDTDPGTATIFGSADVYNSICQGYFNSTLIYRNNQFEVNP